MKKTILYAAVVTGLLFTACKKNHDKSATSLQNKWGVVNETDLVVESEVTTSNDTYTGVAADYIDFRSDNKVYSLVNGGMDTSTYHLLSNNKVAIGENPLADTLDILSLTTSSVQLHEKIYDDPTSYEELTVNLKR